MGYAQQLAAARLQRLKREADPIKVSLTTGTDYAKEGHRLDVLCDERLVSTREPRWIDGRRYIWRSGMWCLSPDLKREAKPHKAPAPRVVEAIRGTEDTVLMVAVRAVVEEGGRPEEVMVKIIEPRP